jgi:hypothetical protein
MKRIFTTLKKKWAEYLLEIMVITIGILGAFGLNSWNDGNKSRQEEQLILRGLQAEFQQNLAELQSDHHYNSLCLNATTTLLQLNGKAMPAHQIDSLIGHMLNYASFEARLGVVNDITSSGKLNLIQDEHLRYLLTQWSGELSDLSEDNLMRRDHYIHQLMPKISEHIPLRNADRSYTRNDYSRELLIKPITNDQEKYDAMLAATEFDGALYTHFINQTFVFTNEKAIEKFINEILLLISQNIETK